MWKNKITFLLLRKTIIDSLSQHSHFLLIIGRRSSFLFRFSIHISNFYFFFLSCLNLTQYLYTLPTTITHVARCEVHHTYISLHTHTYIHLARQVYLLYVSRTLVISHVDVCIGARIDVINVHVGTYIHLTLRPHTPTYACTCGSVASKYTQVAAILVTSFLLALCRTLSFVRLLARSPQLGLVSSLQSFRLHSLSLLDALPEERRLTIWEYGTYLFDYIPPSNAGREGYTNSPRLTWLAIHRHHHHPTYLPTVEIWIDSC